MGPARGHPGARRLLRRQVVDKRATPIGSYVQTDRVLGEGDHAFATAVSGLREWAPQRGSGLSVVTDGPMAPGTNVAMAAPLPIGFAIATCRAVYVDDREDGLAFGYGTLKVHPECGEERFEIARWGETVVFRVIAWGRKSSLVASRARLPARSNPRRQLDT